VSTHVTNQQTGGCHRARIPSPQLNRGDGKAYKALLSDDTDPDLVPRLRDPALLNAFAALADDLRTVMGQIASGKDADRLDDFVRYGADRSPWCAQLKTANGRT
jgi:hypothetical protein